MSVLEVGEKKLKKIQEVCTRRPIDDITNLQYLPALKH